MYLFSPNEHKLIAEEKVLLSRASTQAC